MLDSLIIDYKLIKGKVEGVEIAESEQQDTYEG